MHVLETLKCNGFDFVPSVAGKSKAEGSSVLTAFYDHSVLITGL